MRVLSRRMTQFGEDGQRRRWQNIANRLTEIVIRRSREMVFTQEVWIIDRNVWIQASTESTVYLHAARVYFCDKSHTHTAFKHIVRPSQQTTGSELNFYMVLSSKYYSCWIEMKSGPTREWEKLKMKYKYVGWREQRTMLKRWSRLKDKHFGSVRSGPKRSQTNSNVIESK